MPRPRTSLLLAVAGPPLVLAGVGFAHPMDLTDASASDWKNMHILLLPLFPLLALAPWLVVRQAGLPVLSWVAAALGYTYAIFYTALDVLAGIGAGALQGAGASEQTSVMFSEGNDLAAYGESAYLIVAVLAAAVALYRVHLPALPGAVLVVAGAWFFLDSHIYWPAGVLAMLALAVGWAALVTAMASPGSRRPAEHKT